MNGILIFIAVFFISFNLYSQPQEDSQPDAPVNFWERLYYGGGFAIGSQRNYFYAEISPLVGYGFTERFSTGVGFTYQYISEFRRNYNSYGGRIFSRYGIFNNVFAHAEYEKLNFERSQDRLWSDEVFIGGGYSSHLGAQKGFQMYILFNLNYDQIRSPYRDPYVIRISLTF